MSRQLLDRSGLDQVDLVATLRFVTSRRLCSTRGQPLAARLVLVDPDAQRCAVRQDDSKRSVRTRRARLGRYIEDDSRMRNRMVWAGTIGYSRRGVTLVAAVSRSRLPPACCGTLAGWTRLSRRACRRTSRCPTLVVSAHQAGPSRCPSARNVASAASTSARLVRLGDRFQLLRTCTSEAAAPRWTSSWRLELPSWRPG